MLNCFRTMSWKWSCSTSLVFGFVCLIVVSKKQVHCEGYGDLGDEIIIDYPSQPSRKNEIPKGDDDLRVNKGHIIDQRTIMQKTVSHYKNPLFYREFTPDERVKNARAHIRHSNNARNWRKKDFIHRPLVSDVRRRYLRMPMLNRYITRPAYPRTLGYTERRKLPNPRIMAARRTYNRQAALIKPRGFARPSPFTNNKKVKHHLHVQVIPKSNINALRAHKLGIHSGFVLVPATQTAAKLNAIAQRRMRIEKYKREHANLHGNGKTTKVNRFSERKHIWIPSRRLSARDKAVMTSYHVDDIGNLIPDIMPVPAETKTETPLVRHLEKVTMKWAQHTPSLRNNIKNNPRWRDALSNVLKPKHIISRQPRPQLNIPSRPSSPFKRFRLIPVKKNIVKGPSIARGGMPKSSRQILFFRQDADSVKKTTLPLSKYGDVDPSKDLAKFMDQFEESQGPPIISKEYAIPHVSPKVFRYINDKTGHQPSSSLDARSKNPLLRYLQYHREHTARSHRPKPAVNSARGLINTRRRMVNNAQIRHSIRSPLPAPRPIKFHFPSSRSIAKQFIHPHVHIYTRQKPITVPLKFGFHKKPSINFHPKFIQQEFHGTRRQIKKVSPHITSHNKSKDPSPKISPRLLFNHRKFLLMRQKLKKLVKKKSERNLASDMQQSPYYALIPINQQKSHTRNQVEEHRSLSKIRKQRDLVPFPFIPPYESPIDRRVYFGIPQSPPLPLSLLFAQQDPRNYQGLIKQKESASIRQDVPWNFYHNEVLPDGRVRPALYPISHHIPFGKCLPDGALCDEGHDEQCCGRSAFCQNYWGTSKCVAYSQVSLADMHNPFQIQQNRLYKHFYRYMLSKVELR